MDLRDKFKNKIKSTSIETRDKNFQKLKNRLVSDILEVKDQDKLKNASKNGKIEITRNTESKLDSQKSTSKSFSTPISKSEIDRFVDSTVSSQTDIGRGGSQEVRNFLQSELDNSMETLSNKAKSKSLEEVNHLVNRKISKGQKQISGFINSIFSGAKDIPKRGNWSNNPYHVKAVNDYESKAEVLSYGIVKGQPTIKFELAEADKPDTPKMKKGGSSAGNNSKRKLIKEANLPAVAGSLNTNYSFNYSEKDKPFFEGTVTTALSKFLGSGTKLGQFAQQQGIAVNPNQEKVFTSVDFRNLTFEYIFLPKNEQESQLVDNIVYMFKYWSHPRETRLDASLKRKLTEFGGESVSALIQQGEQYIKLLDYPELWKISYNDGTGGSAGVSFVTKKCYCTKLEVSYGSSEGLMLFEKTNKPSFIRINMAFVESQYVLRDDIRGGY